jgi:hypothetical protein
LNVYSYVNNCPTLWVDPQGLMTPLGPEFINNGTIVGDVTINITRLGSRVLPVAGIALTIGVECARRLDAHNNRLENQLRDPIHEGYPELPRWYEFWAWGIDTDHLKPGYRWPPPPPPPPPAGGDFECRPGGGGFKFCFVAGTWVETVSHAGVPIERLQRGELLCTAAFAGSNLEQIPLDWAGLTGYADEIVVIALENEDVRCSKNHPFWVQRRGWVAASELTTTDLLEDMEGHSVPIVGVSVTSLANPTAVYNVMMAGPQCFFVGQRGVLVRTMCTVKGPGHRQGRADQQGD